MIAIGLFLLIAGLLIRFLARTGGMLAPAMPVASAGPDTPRPEAKRRPEYRVFVPGVGSFASLAEADEWLFDLRLGRRRPEAFGAAGWRVEPA